MYREVVGYKNFHSDANFNFQLNRWLPHLPEADVLAAADQISNFDDWTDVMISCGARAEAAGETYQAAFYYRGADFFMPHGHPDVRSTYENFTRLFHESTHSFQYSFVEVPYENAFLPVYVIGEQGPLVETLVVHGGFDSYAEELLPLVAKLANKGFRIILFEGPGQGYCLNVLGMSMPHDWAKPVRHVLDHMKIENCTLLGVSLGGCLALRAAAFEPRIKRVIANDVLESFFGALAARLGARKAGIISFLLRHNLRAPINRAMARAAEAEPTVRWALDHGLRVSGSSTPFEYLKWAKAMTTRDISRHITQDCLLLAARDDHLVPFSQLEAQLSTLVNARSITTRVFSADEHAGQHCQIGNTGLANRVMADWIIERLQST